MSVYLGALVIQTMRAKVIMSYIVILLSLKIVCFMNYFVFKSKEKPKKLKKVVKKVRNFKIVTMNNVINNTACLGRKISLLFHKVKTCSASFYCLHCSYVILKMSRIQITVTLMRPILCQVANDKQIGRIVFTV